MAEIDRDVEFRELDGENLVREIGRDLRNTEVRDA